MKLKIIVDIKAPLLIVPFKHNNDMQSECWVLSLGNLLLTSEADQPNTLAKQQDQSILNELPLNELETAQLYDAFNLEVTHIKMFYFPCWTHLDQYLAFTTAKQP